MSNVWISLHTNKDIHVYFPLTANSGPFGNLIDAVLMENT